MMHLYFLLCLKNFIKTGQISLAIDGLENLISIHPDYVGAYYHLAEFYKAEELYDKALNIYESGMTIAQKVGDLHALGELKNAKLNLELEEDL